jgi:chaperonin GroES
MKMTIATKRKFKHLGDRVLIQRIEEQETLRGGIVLPNTAKKKGQFATVIAIGTGATTPEGKPIPILVKEGDKVLIDKYAGQEVTIEDEEFVILRANEIIALIN